ncbi:AMP-binding protein [Millisia brevis]|uniref:AMP-binding protein n=1 Tax=Millisia brevis TaxID=264148 RepID=UPI00082DBB7E|nr:AMP-binding protein [Millisia brevis]
MTPGSATVLSPDSDIDAGRGDRTPVRPAGLGDSHIQLESNDVADAVDHLLAGLEAAGVPRGSRVGVYLRGGVEYVVALYALHELAATLVPIDVLDWPAISAIPAAGLDILLTHCCESETIDDVLEVMSDSMTGIEAIDAGYELISIRTDRSAPVLHGGRTPLTVQALTLLMDQTAAALQLGPHDRIAMWDGFCTPIGIATALAARRCGAEVRLGDHCDSATVLMIEPDRLLGHAVTGSIAESIAASTRVVVPGGRLPAAAAAVWGLVEVAGMTTGAIYRCSRAA